MHRQDNRRLPPSGSVHRPTWRASDAVARVRVTQPAPRQLATHWSGPELKRPYVGRGVPGITDEMLEELTHEQLLIVRDKVRWLLGDSTFTRTRIPAIVRAVMAAAAEGAEIEVHDILSDRRSKKIARARQLAMASLCAMRKDDGEPRFRPAAVARFFSRDRSTVNHACSVIGGADLITVEE